MKFVFLICVVFYCIQFISSLALTNSTDLVILKNDEFKCKMFKICKLDILIRNDFSVDLINISSSDLTIFKFNRLLPCSEPKCLSKNYINSFRINSSINYQVYHVEIESVLIGKAVLEFNLNDKALINSCSIIITQPKRIIDIIFNVMIYSFGFIISLLMGILLDKKCILNIFKIPRAMFIGFFCQYLLMPLVIFNLYVLLKKKFKFKLLL